MVQFTPEEMGDCPDCGTAYAGNIESQPVELPDGPWKDDKAVVVYCEDCGYVWSVGRYYDSSGEEASGPQECELCGDEVDELTLTSDSHPEGANHLVGECCTV